MAAHSKYYMDAISNYNKGKIEEINLWKRKPYIDEW